MQIHFSEAGMKLLLCYLLIINTITFILYGADKYKAIKGKWRIPEAVLIFFAAIGGPVGALAGMIVWHHKTRKWKFKILVPLFLLIWIGIIIYVVTR